MTSHLAVARPPRGEAQTLEMCTDRARLDGFLEDAAHVPGGSTPALVVPRTEREAADALRSASRILVVGAQSSLTGGATPRGDTVLSTAALRSIDARAGTLRVGAGVTVAEVDSVLREQGRLYPPGPTWTGATIGGTVATNAAGPATFKHGTTRAWVEALTLVLANGDVLDLRRGDTLAHPDGYFDIELSTGRVRVPVPRYRMPRTAKLSAGYFAEPGMDLIDLFIGSEGTLGVVTEATLRVQPVRPAVCLAFVTLRQRASALALVSRLRDLARETWRRSDPSGLDVSAIEHLDARSLALLREDGVDRRVGVRVDPGAAMALLVTIDLPPGTTSAQVYEGLAGASASSPGSASLARFAELLLQFDAADTLIAPPGDTAAAGQLVALREGVPLAVNARVGRARREVDPRIEKTAADVVVPFDAFGEMLDLYGHELASRGLDAAIWGHISDGNVHPNIIPRSYADVESGREAVLAFGRAAIRLGGSPLAEHGVGRNLTKQRLLVELYGSDGVDDMRRVKRALDPDGKLAPGVIFSPP